MRQDLVLVRPIITEKTMALAQMSQFTFMVNLDANKNQIIKAIEDYFKVNVIEIKTITLKGKIRRFGTKRVPTQLAGTKKAIVTLKKGQKIDLFEIGDEKEEKKKVKKVEKKESKKETKNKPEVKKTDK
ncbi:50S ribosomal protein L23 [Candidatus Beckwithbacteria bacterium]|nr:50S ribosomal protein L23 [Candidatus Beckwithbacteria bacterium]